MSKFDLPGFDIEPSNRQPILYPECGDSRLHLGDPVSVEQGQWSTTVGFGNRVREVNHYRLKQYLLSPDWEIVGGSIVRINLVGECGHDVQFCVGFRDGATSIWLCSGGGGQETKDVPKTLWEPRAKHAKRPGRGKVLSLVRPRARGQHNQQPAEPREEDGGE